MSRNFRVVFTVGGIGEDFGGPSRTITGLAAELRSQRIDASVIAGTSAGCGRPVVPAGLVGNVRYTATQILPQRVRFHPNLRNELVAFIDSHPHIPTIINDNGIWSHSNWCAYSAAAIGGCSYVVSPRGMLEPWSLNHKWLKKWIALRAYQWNSLAGATAFHATAPEEALNLRRLGLKQPIAIVPNGIDTAEMPVSLDGLGLRNREALFLSRVHPKKGLPLLMQAWALASPSGWRLKVAGPDEGGHAAEVRQLATRLGIGKSVEFLGPIEGERKTRLLRSAGLFILPTHSENFGVVVAEALGAGLPVITTKGAPWESIAKERCGWWVDISATALADAIREATALTDAERSLMSHRAKALAACFTWGRIAKDMIQFYNWLSDRNSIRPTFVHLD